MKRTIILSTGGTGGHIFPAIALKKILESYEFSVKITGDERFSKYHQFDQEHIFIPSASFSNKSPIAVLKTILTLAKGFIKSLCLIHKEKPELVLGFGGYATFPVMLASIALGKKIMLHEANTVIGKVNKILLGKAKYLTTGFKAIQGIPLKYQNKTIYTGNPIREKIYPSKTVLENKFSILIIGGSQGAKVFSKIIPDMIANLPKDIKEKLYISQQVKEEDIELLKKKYSQEHIPYEIKSFFDNMDEKLSQANLVIARSGASTISELIKVGLPAIFIPYPTAADNHQYYNAKEIVDQKAGWLVKESSDSASQLLQIIKSIHQDLSILSTYSDNLKKLDMDASNNIAKLIEQCFTK